MNFGSGHGTTVPESDQERFYLDEELAELKLVPKASRVKLGEPLPLSGSCTTRPALAFRYLGTSASQGSTAHHVVNLTASALYMPSFEIRTDASSLQDLAPASTCRRDNLFWSSNGFAFEIPVASRRNFVSLWSDRGRPFGVQLRWTCG